MRPTCSTGVECSKRSGLIADKTRAAKHPNLAPLAPYSHPSPGPFPSFYSFSTSTHDVLLPHGGGIVSVTNKAAEAVADPDNSSYSEPAFQFIELLRLSTLPPNPLKASDTETL